VQGAKKIGRPERDRLPDVRMGHLSDVGRREVSLPSQRGGDAVDLVVIHGGRIRSSIWQPSIGADGERFESNGRDAEAHRYACVVRRAELDVDGHRSIADPLNPKPILPEWEIRKAISAAGAGHGRSGEGRKGGTGLRDRRQNAHTSREQHDGRADDRAEAFGIHHLAGDGGTVRLPTRRLAAGRCRVEAQGSESERDPIHRRRRLHEIHSSDEG
jgi:hypothetical protein